jgi:hypothetical protein
MKKEGNEERFIDLTSAEEIEKLCSELNCDEQTLRRCVNYVGRSITSIESFLFMNRSLLEATNNNINNGESE